MSYSEQIINFLDSILAETGSVDDGEPNTIPNIPEQDPDTQQKQMVDDIGGVGLEEEEPPDIAEIASDMVDDILVEQDSAYQTYFRGVMKKHGATDIKHMSPDKKREFFKDVSSGWKSRKKVKEAFGPKPGSPEYQNLAAGIKVGDPMAVGRYSGGPDLPPVRRPSKAERMRRNRRARVMATRAGVAHNMKPEKGTDYMALRTKKGHGYSEQEIFEDYKKYFTYMLDQCGIEDFEALSEIEQAEFMSLVNEAFQVTNDLIEESQ